MHSIYEIAIQAVKPASADTYPKARAAFLEVLHHQPGIERDWTFTSFFTMPTPDSGRVLVGLTRWASQAAFATASQTLLPAAETQALFSQVDMRAFVQVRTADRQEFKLEDYIQGPQQVLEVAVRRPKPGVSDDQFTAARRAFFAIVSAQEGFLFDREFIDDSGSRVVLIGWRSTDDFMRALGVLQTREEMAAFFGLIDVQAYQAARLG